MKIDVFWVVAPCSLVEVYRRFTGVPSIIRAMINALLMEAESTTETSVNFYKTTLHNNSEDSHLL
jgi:hypothetical protein